MQIVRRMVALGVILGGLAAAMGAQAALQYSTRDAVMRVWGKYENGDVESLKAHLTPAVKTVVVGGITGASWEQGRDLAELIADAGVRTVAYGACTGWACPMMFLSGRERMFSAAGRPESNFLEIPVIADLPNYTCNGVKCTEINAWLSRHSKLRGADMAIYHKSMFTATTDTPPDHLVFFPAQAKFRHANALHCAREVMEEKKKTFTLADCAAIEGATALNRGLVTADDTFATDVVSVRKEIAVPPATAYAPLAAPVDIHHALNDECANVQARFLRYDSPRALVVSSEGGCYARSAESPRPYADAMHACKAGKAKCRFYAVDDAVVFVPFDKPLASAKDDPLEDAAPAAAGSQNAQ